MFKDSVCVVPSCTSSDGDLFIDPTKLTHTQTDADAQDTSTHRDMETCARAHTLTQDELGGRGAGQWLRSYFATARP